MTAFVMLVLLTVIAISVCINVYLLRRRRAPAKDISSVIMQGIRDVNELATVRQTFQSIVIYEDFRSLLGFHLPGTHKKFILKYSGNVVVGADLSKINITQFVSGKVKITLPRSRIFDVSADMKSIEVYDQRSGIFNSLSFDEQNHAIAADLLKIEEESRSGDLLARSDENAENILAFLCKSAGVGVEVEFIDEPEFTQTETQSKLNSPVSEEVSAEFVFVDELAGVSLPEHGEKAPGKNSIAAEKETIL